VDCTHWNLLLCNTTTGVSPASDQSVGCSDDVSIKESGGPYLARYKCTAKNANEKPDGVESSSVVNGTSKGRRDRAEKETANESQTGAESVA
jgi:hypothetical protein